MAEIAELKTIESNNQKWSVFYDKVLIRSPEKLKNDINKNQAKINDLQKMIKNKKKENEDIQSTINERDRFIEDLKPIKDSISHFINTEVKSANKQIRDIEKTKEEITNAEFERNQKQSLIATSQKEIEKATQDYESFRKQTEKILLELKEKDDTYLNQMKQDMNEIKEEEKSIRKVKEEMKKIRDATETLINNKLEEIKKNEQNRELLRSQMKSQMEYDAKEREILTLTPDTISRLFLDWQKFIKF